MQQRKGVIAVLWKPNDNHLRFAVFRRTLNWDGWELVKGGVEQGETEEEALKRETGEESGINEEDILQVTPLEGRVEWNYQRQQTKIEADYKPFLVKVPASTRIRLPESNDEHSQGLFLNFRDARDILTFENNKQLLERAKQIIDDKME